MRSHATAFALILFTQVVSANDLYYTQDFEPLIDSTAAPVIDYGSPVLRYSFTTTNGAAPDVIDDSGNTNNANFKPTSSGGPTWTNFDGNPCIYMDASGKYVQTVGTSLLNGLKQYSVSAWVFLTRVGSVEKILSYNNASIIEFKVNADRSVTFTYSMAGYPTYTTPAGAIQTNSWQYLSMVISNNQSTVENDVFQFWVNGTYYASTNYVAPSGTSVVNAAFSIGQDGYDASGKLKGYVDDVRMWPYAISTQINASVYNGGTRP